MLETPEFGVVFEKSLGGVVTVASQFGIASVNTSNGVYIYIYIYIYIIEFDFQT